MTDTPDTPSLAEQIAAVRRAGHLYATFKGEESQRVAAILCAALTTLEKHERALAVVEALREIVALPAGTPVICMDHARRMAREALAAFDAGEQPR